MEMYLYIYSLFLVCLATKKINLDHIFSIPSFLAWKWCPKMNLPSESKVKSSPIYSYTWYLHPNIFGPIKQSFAIKIVQRKTYYILYTYIHINRHPWVVILHSSSDSYEANWRWMVYIESATAACEKRAILYIYVCLYCVHITAATTSLLSYMNIPSTKYLAQNTTYRNEIYIYISKFLASQRTKRRHLVMVFGRCFR